VTTLDDHDLFPEPDDREPRKCRHPRPYRMKVDGVDTCTSCSHVFDPIRQAMGRRNRKRGNSKELASAKRNATVRSGQFGGKDDYRVKGLFAFQNKSMVTSRFPGWMTNEIDAVRKAWPDLEPVLHVEESPGPGHRPRRLYVVDEKTWLALHGPTTREDAA
jgi:hypothetical protein